TIVCCSDRIALPKRFMLLYYSNVSNYCNDTNQTRWGHCHHPCLHRKQSLIPNKTTGPYKDNDSTGVQASAPSDHHIESYSRRRLFGPSALFQVPIQFPFESYYQICFHHPFRRICNLIIII
uniref:Uncharacterized protein n=1 Tax=Callorhinchus milii TaxID=7868 RepID=A0A4W3K6C7_CALMI